jgi:hypothetical protein
VLRSAWGDADDEGPCDSGLADDVAELLTAVEAAAGRAVADRTVRDLAAVSGEA